MDQAPHIAREESRSPTAAASMAKELYDRIAQEHDVGIPTREEVLELMDQTFEEFCAYCGHDRASFLFYSSSRT